MKNDREEKKPHIICFKKMHLDLVFLGVFIGIIIVAVIPLMTDFKINYDIAGLEYGPYIVVTLRYLLMMVKIKDPSQPPELFIWKTFCKQWRDERKAMR